MILVFILFSFFYSLWNFSSIFISSDQRMLLKSDTMSLQQLVQSTSVYKTACLFSVHVVKSVSEIVLVFVRFLCRNFSFCFVLVFWITIILVLVLWKRRPIILVLVLIFVTKITLGEGGRGVSQVKPSDCFRRLDKFVSPSIFDISHSSLMMWNLRSYYPTTVLNERTWRFRGGV